MAGEEAHHSSPSIALLAAPRAPSLEAPTMGGAVPAWAWLSAWLAAARHLQGRSQEELRSRGQGQAPGLN